jgi:hypothetical protein
MERTSSKPLPESMLHGTEVGNPCGKGTLWGRTRVPRGREPKGRLLWLRHDNVDYIRCNRDKIAADKHRSSCDEMSLLTYWASPNVIRIKFNSEDMNSVVDFIMWDNTLSFTSDSFGNVAGVPPAANFLQHAT